MNSCCTALNIVTPVKQFSEDHWYRSPSSRLPTQTANQKCILDSIARLHKFCHSHSLIKLEEMRLSIPLRDQIRGKFSKFTNDVISWLIDMECVAMTNEEFSTITRDYIHYEFDVQKEFSFTVFILLNYIIKNHVDVDIAFFELFQLDLKCTYCNECCEAEHDILKLNINYAKKISYREQVNNDLDDSVVDKDFEIKDMLLEESSDSLSSTDGPENQEKRICLEMFAINNPFDSDSSDQEGSNYSFVNPFFESVSSDVEENISIQSPRTSSPVIQFSPIKGPRTSSPVNPVRLASHQCKNCMKSFQTRYNLKMHMIQFHRIFPPETTVYVCPEKTCSFATGSRILYNRHSSTHVRKVIKLNNVDQKVRCNVCNVLFVNKSSFKRHFKRKHT